VSSTSLFRRSRSLWYGVTLPYVALRLILATPVLMFWSLLPIVLTLILYVYFIGALQDWALLQVTEHFQAWGWSREGWTVWVASLVTRLVLILVGAVTFTFTSTMVASPFNDVLAEKTESRATPPLAPVTGTGLAQQLRLIWIDLVKTIAATAAGVIAILFSWIPVVNVVAFVAVFLLVCFQYTSYPQTRRRERLGAGMHFLIRHAWSCAGFGAAITFLYAIPFVSSFALPLAVVGGTLLVARAGAGSDLPALK
jgi:CysZ protein